MQLKALLEADDAVSPVIGVILMVAITVILAAVIGSFVLGLGNQVSEAQPSPTISFNYSNSVGTGTSVGITHDGGDTLDQSDLNVSIAGTTRWSEGTGVNLGSDFLNISGEGWNSSSISATDRVVFYELSTKDTIGQGDDVVVVWKGSTGDTAILAENEIR